MKNSPIFQKYFEDFELIFPNGQNMLINAIYGKHGIKNGYLDGLPLEHVADLCSELMAGGCEVILPGITEISLITDQLRKRGIPVIDVNRLYADFALEINSASVGKPFKLGIMGGVGPSATVDFMQKIIQNTPASRDQEHIKMVVEQNPQIPDRTAHIVEHKTDPTIAMFSTCKRLEAEGADVIAIPCNTAHAFVKSIQEHLRVPIINMLSCTAEYILNEYGPHTCVGLLATSGTLDSRVYTDILEQFGCNVVVPDMENQNHVMDSIYGEKGVKAGYQSGASKDNILIAADYLIRQGAKVIILGCTELPLLFAEESEIQKDGQKIVLIDPTLILAKKIVELSQDSLM